MRKGEGRVFAARNTIKRKTLAILNSFLAWRAANSVSKKIAAHMVRQARISSADREAVHGVDASKALLR